MLEQLRQDSRADFRIRREIEEQIIRLKAGERGESNAAYELKVHFAESRNWIVINDLRIEHDGLVAQIDHVLIGRMLDVWVCESKHVANGVKINDHGEFTTFVGGRPVGMASPIEQNLRHILVLQRVFDAGVIKLPTRFGITLRPKLRSLVLITKGSISRPKVAVRGIDSVIKTEHVRYRVTKADEEGNPLDLAKLVSFATIEDIGRQLVACHRPIVFDWEARLRMKASTAPEPARGEARPFSPAGAAFVAAPNPAAAQDRPEPATLPAAAAKASDPACKQCGTAVSRGVRTFCLTNPTRFGGEIYCMPCQPAVTAIPR